MGDPLVGAPGRSSWKFGFDPAQPGLWERGRAAADLGRCEEDGAEAGSPDAPVVSPRARG